MLAELEYTFNSTIDRVFGSQLGQIKDYNNDIYRFSSKNEALKIWYLLLYTCVSHQLPNCITLSAYYLLFIVVFHILPMIYYLLLHCTFYLSSTIYCCIAHFTYDLLFIDVLCKKEPLSLHWYAAVIFYSLNIYIVS